MEEVVMRSILLLGLGLLLVTVTILAWQGTSNTTALNDSDDRLDHVTDLGTTSSGAGTCAVTLDGTTKGLWCWGNNNEGQIGDNTGATYAVAPVPVCEDGRWEPDYGTPQPDPGCYADGGTPSPFTDAEIAARGFRFACAVKDSGASGTVWCWGTNPSGQLGNDSTTASDTPVQVCTDCSADPKEYLTNVVALASGASHNCALTTADEVWCWGSNAKGELGDGTYTNRDEATKITTISDVTAVSAGYWNTCAIVGATAKAAMCWGANIGIGDGYTCQPFCNHPVDVCALGETGPCSAAADTNLEGVTAIAAAGYGINVTIHSCAVLAEGDDSIVACWGSGGSGQLGDGTATNIRLTPVRVCGSGSECGTDDDVLTGVSTAAGAVVGGWYHTCALMDNDQVKCWGAGDDGQLGNNDEADQKNPVDVCLDAVCSADLDDVDEIAAGFEHTCARMSGKVKCWGRNDTGDVGDGTTINRLAPVYVMRDTDRDGCTDKAEAGSDDATGGNRDPKNHWDFFDTPDQNNVRDQIVYGTVTPGATPAVHSDFSAVVDKNGSGGTPTNDPFAAPPSTPSNYHPAFDRAPSLGPPDGAIGIIDILAVAAQFGDDCSDLPTPTPTATPTP